MDDIRTIKQNEIIGLMPAVFIFPEDIQLTAGPASNHRQFLNIYISQYKRSYLNDLIAYRKIIMQRNKLLKDIAENRENIYLLDVWDKLLVEHAERIIAERRAFIEAISSDITKYYSKFDSDSELDIKYSPKIDPKQESISSAIETQLDHYRERELRAGLTLVGPHRDRMNMKINGKSILHYSSRGQKRIVMLAIKLATADYLSQVNGKDVILILDEVFAELDKAKSQSLMQALTGHKQVFIATAGELTFDKAKAKVFKVESGQVEEIFN